MTVTPLLAVELARRHLHLPQRQRPSPRPGCLFPSPQTKAFQGAGNTGLGATCPVLQRPPCHHGVSCQGASAHWSVPLSSPRHPTWCPPFTSPSGPVPTVEPHPTAPQPLALLSRPCPSHHWLTVPPLTGSSSFLLDCKCREVRDGVQASCPSCLSSPADLQHGPYALQSHFHVVIIRTSLTGVQSVCRAQGMEAPHRQRLLLLLLIIKQSTRKGFCSLCHLETHSRQHRTCSLRWSSSISPALFFWAQAKTGGGARASPHTLQVM